MRSCLLVRPPMASEPPNIGCTDAERALIQAEMRRTNFGPLEHNCHECLSIAYLRVIAVALVGLLSHLETEG